MCFVRRQLHAHSGASIIADGAHERTARRCLLLLSIGLEARTGVVVFSCPPALSPFEGGWNGSATHGVCHTVYCLSLLSAIDWWRFGAYKEYVHYGLAPLGYLSSETASVGAPVSWLGGELSGTAIMIGNEKQRPVPRFLYLSLIHI